MGEEEGIREIENRPTRYKKLGNDLGCACDATLHSSYIVNSGT